MSNPDSPKENVPGKMTSETSLAPETEKVSAAVRSLLEGDTIEDADDRRTVEDALAFIEKPTKDLEEIKGHQINIAMVLGKYGEIDQQPPAINAIQYKLYTLASQQYIALIETALEGDEPDSLEIQELIKKALNFTGILVKYYNDDVLFGRVNELQEILRSVPSQ